VHSIAGFDRPPLQITNASASHETTGWNDYEFLFGMIDEPNDALECRDRMTKFLRLEALPNLALASIAPLRKSSRALVPSQ
jgi:hypothetical protein